MIKERNTIQMQQILEYLKSVKCHPDAKAVYWAIKKKIPTITLATVYRNLNKLFQQGKIQRIEINGEYRFDADTEFHQHCICKVCGKIFDVHNKNFSDYALKHCKAEGFSPEKVSIIFQGQCNKKAKKPEKQKTLKENRKKRE
jgi:Fur family transcriptional regulator, ferric uptake regulator